MTIAPQLVREFPDLNESQRKIIGHLDGPLLVIAGPGSGKTYSLVLRTVNLLLLGKAEPGEIVVATFTEKAAFEIRDRISAAASRLGYKGDLFELRTGTIHGVSNRILQEHRHRTPLGNNYGTLDDLGQLLFLYEHFDDVVGADAPEPYFGKWGTKWTAIRGMRDYFNKITEEMLSPDDLIADENPFLVDLGKAYGRYRATLFQENQVDFAHQQRLVADLLEDPEIRTRVTAGIRYVMVDEYQDTNYVQEQLLERLSSATGNLCVVGDEDQSLYRFRGATVRNILEFPQHHPSAEVVKLTTNYRSHRKIVEAYDRWMASADWSNPDGTSFRFDKTIEPNDGADHPDYPAVFAVWGRSPEDEAERFADLVGYLKDSSVIEDYNQIALLLQSVQERHSGPYIAALRKRGIPAFCPRARAFFDNDEIRLMVASLAVIFGWHGKGRGEIRGRALNALARYVDAAIVDLAKHHAPPDPLGDAVRRLAEEIDELGPDETLDVRPADYLYELLALPAFADALAEENRARNLAVLTQLINAFQNHYHYSVVTGRNKVWLRRHLFNSFFRLLHDGGINEYEDPDQPFPSGYVQIMTIHQAKGLEFPVVAVGSLDVVLSTAKEIDRTLGHLYRRPPFEPEDRITQFDRMRLHYVAFSRAEKILVLTSDQAPKRYFRPITQGLPQWPYVEKDLLAAQHFEPKDRAPVKKRYSFTGDLKVYETCPRQYQFFRHYDFTPSRSAVIFFGLLVHETIEEIHRIVLDGQGDTLDEQRIRELFDRTFGFLAKSDVRPIGERAREAALTQVLNYFRQNQDKMSQVLETEVDVSVEKDGYILTGKVDLLMDGDGKLEILDFKTSERPAESPELLASYERQLCTYAHILEERRGIRPERLLLYWTAEPRREDALMEFPYRPELVEQAGIDFDQLVAKIEHGDFRILVPPERKICKECDLRRLCVAQGVIESPG